MRRSIILSLILAMFAALSVPSTAADTGPNRRQPPKLRVIYKGEIVQRATPYTYCWTYSEGDGGVGMCADGFPRYPRGVAVEAPARIVIRIPYPAKPSDWFVEAHRTIVRHENWDEPVGPAQDIAFKLKPRWVDGKVRAWKVIFHLEEPQRHYYLNTGGFLAQGDALYALHVKT
ncbi:MAG: hypothetical protein ACR2KQ_11395 [Actinomycetota bacterium]